MIKPINMFHTPKDWRELLDWVNRHAKSDRPHLLTAAAMGWNAACKETASAAADMYLESIRKEKSE